MKVVVKQFKKPLYEASILNEDLINGGELFLGRESDCHIALNSHQISRYHASISLKQDKVNLHVLSEYGGVRINGNEIKTASLQEGDKIEIGEYEILISQLPDIMPEDDLVISNEVSEQTVMLSDPIGSETSQTDDFLEPITDNVPVEAGGFEISEEDLLEPDQSSDFLEEDNSEEHLVENNEPKSGELSEFHNVENLEESDGESQATEQFEAGNEFPDENNEAEQGDNFDSNDFSTEDNFGSDDDFSDDGGFGSEEDGFSEDSGSEESTEVIQSFAKFSLKLFGEFAPIDRYFVEDNEVHIGRDPEKCQIVLEDPEVSKVHVVIKKTFMSCSIEDLDSANGIIFNGERVKKANLSNGDEFIIGDTSFTVEVTSDIIESEKGMLMPVEENQEVEIEEIVEEEVGFEGFDGEGDDEFGGVEVEEKSVFKKIWSDPKKKRIAIVLIAVLGLVFLLDEDPSESTRTPEQLQKDALAKKKKQKSSEQRKKFSPEILEKLEQNYALALAKFNNGEFYEAKEYLDIVTSVDPGYKDAPSLGKLIQEGLDELVRIDAKEREEKARKERQIKINALIEKAREAVKKREVRSAENYFNMIFEIDPENIDVPPLKLEIEVYVEEEKRKKQEAAIIKAKRQAKVDKLAPGKALFLKGEWYKAVDRLEKFIREKDMDEDLLKEGTSMLRESQKKLLLMINPLLSKARSFKEGQDLKQAYETYGEVLKYDPANEEALNERDNIFETLKNRSKKIYRDALVAESLSLYGKAKEKFQEVQQISPINSEYYNKASDKLKNYLE